MPTSTGLREISRVLTGPELSEMFNITERCRRIENVRRRGHRTYTYEASNSLKPADVPRFLDEMRVRYPGRYAFVFLGFTTGLRPSSLRPLRARGPEAGIKWEEGTFLVRRSHTRAAEVMDSTKTDRAQVIALDERQLEVLRWPPDRPERENVRRAQSPEIAAAMRASDLLLPAAPTKWNHGGGMRSASCLDKAFAAVGTAIGLGYAVTPRAMRRTYQDLSRAAKAADIVTRSISGHATPEIQASIRPCRATRCVRGSQR